MAVDAKKLLMKFDRFCAWGLIGIMAVFFISGYGMTQGVISPQVSKWLHETLLPIPGIIAFAFHSAYGMHIALKRWKIWGSVPKTFLIVYCLILIGGIVIMEFVTGGQGKAPEPTSIEL